MSDYRESANRRRDERQSKGKIRRPSGSKKNTKKWCRGKVGIEHEPMCVDYDDHKRRVASAGSRLKTVFHGWKLLVCKKCKKELDYYFPIRFPSMAIHQKPPPAWVCE